ncbi:uncharacterized protein LOC143299889 [Babylonia areolata]|uniref:uncharacterized protein LOC143299889 n=1 Tax=Babylonia areolata TaxID=304850 RepID=UPI003FD00169
MRRKNVLSFRFPGGLCTRMLPERRAVTSLLLVMLVTQVTATDEDVDLQHIADLSADIDLRTSFTSWLHHLHHLPGPPPFRPAPTSHGQSHVHTDTRRSQAEDRDTQGAVSHTGSRHPVSGALAARPETPDPPRPNPDIPSVSGSGKAFPATLTGTSRMTVKKEFFPVTPLAEDSGGGGETGLGQVHTAPRSERLATARSDPNGAPAGEGRTPRQLTAAVTDSQALTHSGHTSLTQTGEDNPLPGQKGAGEDNPVSRQRRNARPPDPGVVHMSAKRLARLEEELATRRLTEPEHKLYHQDLLLRRLKTLHQTHRHGKQGEGGQGGEDGWGEELRIRQDLADRALQYGAEKRRQRLANPDPDRPLSVLDRIHKDAEEILRRRAQEKEFLKNGMTPRTRHPHGQQLSRGDNEGSSKGENQVAALGSVDQTHRKERSCLLVTFHTQRGADRERVGHLSPPSPLCLCPPPGPL